MVVEMQPPPESPAYGCGIDMCVHEKSMTITCEVST